MKNQVIKVINVEHGETVKEYFKYLGYDIGDFNHPNYKLLPNTYYGVINGKFNDYSVSEILRTDAELIELPINSKTNKKKVGRPKLSQEEKVEIAKEKAAKEIAKKITNEKFGQPQTAEEPTNPTKVLQLDLSILSNGKLSLYFECENHGFINKLLEDISNGFVQSQPSMNEPLFPFK